MKLLVVLFVVGMLVSIGGPEHDGSPGFLERVSAGAVLLFFSWYFVVAPLLDKWLTRH